MFLFLKTPQTIITHILYTQAWEGLAVINLDVGSPFTSQAPSLDCIIIISSGISMVHMKQTPVLWQQNASRDAKAGFVGGMPLPLTRMKMPTDDMDRCPHMLLAGIISPPYLNEQCPYKFRSKMSLLYYRHSHLIYIYTFLFSKLTKILCILIQLTFTFSSSINREKLDIYISKFQYFF